MYELFPLTKMALPENTLHIIFQVLRDTEIIFHIYLAPSGNLELTVNVRMRERGGGIKYLDEQ